MSKLNLSRRNFFGATVTGGAALAGRALAQSTGVNPADLPDLTIKEVKVYVLKPAEAAVRAPAVAPKKLRRDRLRFDMTVSPSSPPEASCYRARRGRSRSPDRA